MSKVAAVAVEEVVEEVKEEPIVIDKRFDDWVVSGGTAKAKGASRWKKRLAELQDDHGEGNEQLYVLDMLPITPAQKCAMSKEFF